MTGLVCLGGMAMLRKHKALRIVVGLVKLLVTIKRLEL